MSSNSSNERAQQPQASQLEVVRGFEQQQEGGLFLPKGFDNDVHPAESSLDEARRIGLSEARGGSVRSSEPDFLTTPESRLASIERRSARRREERDARAKAREATAQSVSTNTDSQARASGAGESTTAVHQDAETEAKVRDMEARKERIVALKREAAELDARRITEGVSDVAGIKRFANQEDKARLEQIDEAVKKEVLDLYGTDDLSDPRVRVVLNVLDEKERIESANLVAAYEARKRVEREGAGASEVQKAGERLKVTDAYSRNRPYAEGGHDDDRWFEDRQNQAFAVFDGVGGAEHGALGAEIAKPFKKKSVVAVVAVVAAASVVGLTVLPARAERPDCDGNAVLYCGAYDVGTLMNKYNSSSSARSIYASSPFGISNSEFKSLSGGYVEGYVTRNNTVYAGGKLVATGAVTAGRSYIPGSSKLPGASGYYRAPSVSFKQYSLSAFVKLDSNGRFMFAVIKACGNPVVGKPTAPAPKPSFEIEKKVKLAYSSDQFQENITVKTGARVEYAIAVTNTGNVSLSNMMVRDKLPNSMSYVAGSTYMNTSYSGQKRLPDGVAGRGINIGTVPVKGTAYVFFKADAPKASNTNLKICETGQKSLLHNVAYAAPTGLPEKNNGADVQTCRPGQPNFEIVKKVKVAGTKDEYSENVFAKPGTLLEFVVGVTNTGNIELKNTVVTDALPKGLTYKANTTRLVTSRGTDKKLPDSPSLFYKGVTLERLQPKEVAFIFFQAYLPKADSTEVAVKECENGRTKLVNIAKAKPAGLHTKQDDASAETCKEVEKKPNFEITKDVRKKGDSDWKQDVTVKYGESVEYRIVVKNTGETDLKNVVVKDARPTGVDYVNGTLKVNGQSSSQDLFGAGVTISEIKLGQSAEITFEAKVKDNASEDCKSADFKNIASAKPEGLETKTDDAIVKVNCVVIEKHPEVKIKKVANKSVIEVGEQFTYTLEVTNTGDVALKDVKVTDPSPASVEFVSSDTPDGTTVNVTASNFEATISNLAVGQKVNFNIQSKVVSEQPNGTTNTACVDATETPGNPDDCDSVTVKTPFYECKALSALSLGDYKYRFSVIVSKSDTVNLTSVSYNFGDNSDAVVVNNQDAVEHQYAEPEAETTYKTVATVTFDVNGVAKQATCETDVTLKPTPDEVCKWNPNLPADSPYCFEPCVYDESIPADSPNCKPPVNVCPECDTPPALPPSKSTPTPPVTVVPATGAEGVATMALGSSGIIYALYAWVESKRALKRK